MSSPATGVDALPIDPTFPPAAYERVALLLRTGVISFFVLASIGLVVALVANPSETVASMLAFDPRSLYMPPAAFLANLVALNPSAIILLGIYLMVAVTIARVGYAAMDFARGRERTLTWAAIAVVVLLLIGLFVVAPFIH